METKKEYIAGLYCRLSKDDDLRGESLRIGTQRAILLDYCSSLGIGFNSRWIFVQIQQYYKKSKIEQQF